MEIVGAAASAMPPTDAATVAAAHKQLLADTAIQFQMSNLKPPRPPPDWLIALLRFLGSGAGKIVLWVLVAAAVLFLLYKLVPWLIEQGWLWQRRPKAEEAVDQDAWRPEENSARALLRDADALAQEGRFDEAVHLLLFRSIEDIDSRRPKLVRPALTSRDIAGAEELPDAPRDAFSTIVMTVERSLFGGRSLLETDWRTCRASYEKFAFAEAWR